MILLAEDSQDDALAVQLVLQRASVVNPVHVVMDGHEAISYLEGEGKYSDRGRFPFPTVLLLDLIMPRFGGIEILEWLAVHPRRAEILVIVLSGHEDLQRIGLAYALGAKSFLMKPCQIEDIQNLVKAYPTHWITAPGGKAMMRPIPPFGSIMI